ncbi:MAG: polysaccharide deacetylase family protein, partial [Firmicutes bacterium]|nr:polysaccharide deacetylase family protein [Bacillota bacterium]
MHINSHKLLLKIVLRLNVKLILFALTGLFLLSLLIALIQLALPLNYSQQIVILTYHRVSDKMTNPWDAGETVTPQQFRDQLFFLKQHGFHVMALDKALETLQNRQQIIPPNSVVLTFDDGDRTYAKNALPILKEFQYPSTEFIIGIFSLSAKSDYLSWPQISELAKDPLVTFHSHTYNSHSAIDIRGKTYFKTDPVYLLGKNRMESDSEHDRRILNDSKQEQALFKKNIGRTDNVIALPYGHAAQSYISLAQTSGYTYFLTQD